MKATEFAQFFDFTIYPREECVIPQNLVGCGPFCMCEMDEIKYVVIDNQGIFQSRYISDVSQLSECFDSMLKDYIDDDIEDNGFVYNSKQKKTYYEQALEWLKKSSNEMYKEGYLEEILKALTDPTTIEDDLKEKEMSI